MKLTILGRETGAAVIEDDRERFGNEKLQAIVDTLSGNAAKPGTAYFDPPSIRFEPTEPTHPKLVMADGDRRLKKRRTIGNEPDAGKALPVPNVLHRTGLRPRHRSETPLHEVLRRQEEQGPRGETPSGPNWESDEEEGSDDERYSESESDGSDKDYAE